MSEYKLIRELNRRTPDPVANTIEEIEAAIEDTKVYFDNTEILLKDMLSYKSIINILALAKQGKLERISK